MEERKDIVGNNINIGDEVAYNPPYYKGIKTGIITGFTPKGVKIDSGTIFGVKIDSGTIFGVIKVIRENNDCNI